MGIFSIERERQDNAAKAIGEITFVLPLHVQQMHAKRCLDPFRQHRPPILLSLSTPHQELMPSEVDVFHADLQALM